MTYQTARIILDERAKRAKAEYDLAVAQDLHLKGALRRLEKRYPSLPLGSVCIEEDVTVIRLEPDSYWHLSDTFKAHVKSVRDAYYTACRKVEETVVIDDVTLFSDYTCLGTWKNGVRQSITFSFAKELAVVGKVGRFYGNKVHYSLNKGDSDRFLT